MKCQDFSQLISAQLDGRLHASERRRLTSHLSECASCRNYAEELQGLRRDLQSLQPRLPDSAMAADIMNALHLEAKLQVKAALAREDRREAWRVRIFAHSIGTVVSCLLLLFLSFEILSPLHRTMMIAQAMARTAINGEDEFNQLSHLLLPPPPSQPNFSPSGELLGFSEQSPEGEFIVSVVVDQNGRASVKEIMDGQTDPAMIAQLSHVLNHQASFTPAKREGKYVAADAVIMFSKVNIKA